MEDYEGKLRIPQIYIIRFLDVLQLYFWTLRRFAKKEKVKFTMQGWLR